MTKLPRPEIFRSVTAEKAAFDRQSNFSGAPSSFKAGAFLTFLGLGLMER